MSILNVKPLSIVYLAKEEKGTLGIEMFKEGWNRASRGGRGLVTEKPTALGWQAQWVKAFATMSDNLSWNARTHIVEGKK